MAPRASSLNPSSPSRATSNPAVARRLDFEQDESSLQETPALSGSGQRRGKRADVYDIPEDESPLPQTSAEFDESLVQEEITANENSVIINALTEESFVGQIGDDTVTGAEAMEDPIDEEEESEPVKQPAKRGRKRKSDVLQPAQDEAPSATKTRKRGPAPTQASSAPNKPKKTASIPTPTGPSRRSKRVSDMTEHEPSVLDASVDLSADATEEVEEVPVPAKRRGRPPRAKPDAEKENTTTAKATKTTTSKSKQQEEPSFKKPPKPLARSKTPAASKNKADASTSGQELQTSDVTSGKLVDAAGKPLSKKDIEQMSTTSVGSRFGRGRHLSVFRELEPEAVARVGRTGRHRVAPIDFWRNDRISYDLDGSMTSIVKNQGIESPRKETKSYGRPKGKKRSLTAIEEEEIELEPWEEEGKLVGNYRDFDPATDTTLSDILEDSELSFATYDDCHRLTL